MNNNRRSEDHERPDNTKPETVVTILEDFCSYTTSGGLGRVVGTKYFALKILWVIIFFGALAAAIIQLVTLFETYQRKPISTRISLEHSVSLPFPSVTFCNFNIIRKSHLSNLSQTIQQSFEEFNTKSNMSGTGTPVKKNNISSADDDDEGYTDPDDLDDAQKAAETISFLLAKEDSDKLKQHGHQLLDMIHSCKYNGKDCRDGATKRYWTSFWHYKFGNCYTFNPRVINGKQQKALKASRSGASHGLHLEINVQQDEYVELTEDAGVVMHISPRGQMAFPFEEGLSLAPGFSTLMGMRRVHILRLDPFKNSSCVSQNKVIANNIYTKIYNASYSKTACVQSCIAFNQRKECGCMEHKYNPKDKMVCDILDRPTVKCLRRVLTKARNNELNCATTCPPVCQEEVFKISSSFSTWPSSSYQEFLSHEYDMRKEKGSKSSRLSNNLLKAQIFYQDLNYERIQETISYGLENFVADIGGQLGLWLGVSVLTGAELVELVILIFLHFFPRTNGHHQRKKNEVAMEEGNFT